MTAAPNWASPPSTQNIVVGASPFLFMNPYPGLVVVSGGAVSLIEISRDEITFFASGLVAGNMFLCPGDSVRVTYTVAPTMTWMPVL